MKDLDIVAFLSFIQSEQSAQYFLKKCYTQLGEKDADKQSYQNCNAFIYYLKHGQQFIKTGKETSLEIKPILLFYGLVHLLKATLLTKRPNYPETTKLLAHGVSSRKRKKKDYTFMNDEVKIQHHGLFPYFSEHLYSIKHFNSHSNTVKMSLLLSLIPEMNSLFSLNNQSKLTEIGLIGGKKLFFPGHLLNTYHLTENAFIQRISQQDIMISQTKNTSEGIVIKLKYPIKRSFGPFLFNVSNQHIYFPSHRNDFLPYSEVMIHYLLLYNLSMVSRYESEWWGDLLSMKSDSDFSFISYYLEQVSDKFSLLLGYELYQDYLNLENG